MFARRLAPLLAVVTLMIGLAGCRRTSASAAKRATRVVEAPRVVFFESQPMVVDVTARLTAGTALELTVPADPGVRVGAPSRDGDAVTVRLRGLAPKTAYVARVTLSGGGGPAEVLELRFETRPPLPGFIAKFEPKVSGPHSGELRLFDLSVSPLMKNGAIYAIDPSGTTRFYLPHSSQATLDSAVPSGVKLLDDGSLAFVQSDRAINLDELGRVLMDLPAKQLGVARLHHDIIQLPSGRFVSIGTEFKDLSFAFDGKTHHVGGDVLVEFTRAGEVTWRWSTFDHLDPQRTRAGFFPPMPLIDPDTQQKSADWTHANAVIPVPGEDAFLFSVRHQDFIVKIDRKTSRVLWRLGEGGDFTLEGGASWFYHQHSPKLEPDGSLLVYDNGVGSPHRPVKESFARPLRLALDEAKQTARITWEDSTEKYYAPIAGDVRRLENGNILVLDSMITMVPNVFQATYARLRELEPATRRPVWQLDLPNRRFSYRCLATRRLPGEPRGAPAP
ncbi:MAG: aryl-sulfate sulfotransferase [Sorangiineae bacterium]|nr:aryl-sulfate sulfotransferase [Polyangiaceae bacterium]MEB2323116.1 aryl-sulfate sulfotransferase [Sorangiineae bacterium]